MKQHDNLSFEQVLAAVAQHVTKVMAPNLMDVFDPLIFLSFPQFVWSSGVTHAVTGLTVKHCFC